MFILNEDFRERAQAFESWKAPEKIPVSGQAQSSCSRLWGSGKSSGSLVPYATWTGQSPPSLGDSRAREDIFILLPKLVFPGCGAATRGRVTAWLQPQAHFRPCKGLGPAGPPPGLLPSSTKDPRFSWASTLAGGSSGAGQSRPRVPGGERCPGGASLGSPCTAEVQAACCRLRLCPAAHARLCYPLSPSAPCAFLPARSPHAAPPAPLSC